MTVFLHNSLSRSLEEFRPQTPGLVTMYVCGPTVYDTPHIGNARPAVIFDVLYRLLSHVHGTVRYARNFTDIDDKIMERAAKNGETIQALTKRTIAEYHEVTSALRVLKPMFEPRATGYVPQMQALITTLIAQGHAYEAEGHVLFDVASNAAHGKLSRHEQHNLDSGHRVEVASYKRSPGDFVLWKPSTDDQPGWESPWGRGRPGWHIECSAMIDAIFRSQTIDIHGGGGDLRFPHHDCEISQTECAHHHPLANYWLHNGMVLIGGEKMAKSAGNFMTPRELLDDGVPGEAIRLALLSAHYRSPLDWDDTTLATAEQALHKWTNALLPFKGRISPKFNAHAQQILTALSTDLNTPQAIAEMHDLAGKVNRGADDEVVAGMLYGARLLGVLHDLTEAIIGVEPAIQALVDARNAARANREFERADQLRDELLAQGIHIRDTKGETVWWRG